ncbi:MAG: DUF1080 domain-containing protein [Phycisphaerae bacterium]|nr:DUF1080 domain-containing protein [Phycisphaerae bacterium]
MKRTILLLGVMCAVLLAPPLAAVAEEAIQPTKKIVLFDGKSFDGLVRHVRGGGDVEKTWAIKDGVLACTGRPPGYIRTAKAYKNYKFHVEYRWPAKTGNNGILVHMTGKDGVWPKSLECQGMYRNQGDYYQIGGVTFNELKIGGHRARGRRVAKYNPHNEKEAGEWNVYEVWCVGGTVRPYVNGKLMNEATDCSVTEGKICLQSEGVPIEFRNIYVEPATDKPWPVVPAKKTVLFNGKNLTGWVRFIPNDKRGPDKKWTVDKVWSVKDGVIHCIGKPHGYIRTEDSYANYKLHFEWRWTDKPTNSGVLLHRAGMDRVWPKCIEAQLMHKNAGDFWIIGGATIKHGGTVKKGHGAKKKPSNEVAPGEWNTYDIVCDGGTVKLTINGLLQNEGTDANPSSGPICLQSEGSPIEFRNIYLEPLGKGKPAGKPKPAGAGKDQVVFEDRFEAKPGKGWTWLRENPKAWRIRKGALEIHVEPGVAHNVKNALVRAAPDRSKGTYAIEVTVTSNTKPTQQFEQAGITWYHNGKPIFKLVKELVRGKLLIIPGVKPMDSKSVQLRLIVTADSYTAQYRPDAKGEFLTAAKGRLPAPGKDQVSIQCYNGPPDAEHWIGFDDFRILKLAD